MLLKGKRTFESFINAISLHLSQGDWEIDEDDEAAVVFGAGEWTAEMDLGDGASVDGVELVNENYSEMEVVIVEKAIALLEGIEWSDEVGGEEVVRKPRRHLKSKTRIKDEQEEAEDGEEHEE